MSAPPAIELDALSRSFGGRPVLQGISLAVLPGERVALMGPNGSGKTTLLEVIATLLCPTSGRAAVQGFDVVREGARARRSLGYCSSNLQSFYPRLTGRANLVFFGSLYGLDSPARVDRLLDRVGLAKAARERTETYSDGMKARLAIARSLLTDPPVLVADEPSKSLDADGKAALRDLLTERAGSPRAILWVTHDPREAAEVAARAYRLDRGTLVPA